MSAGCIKAVDCASAQSLVPKTCLELRADGWPRSRRGCETWERHEPILHAVRPQTLIRRISVSLILSNPGSP